MRRCRHPPFAPFYFYYILNMKRSRTLLLDIRFHKPMPHINNSDLSIVKLRVRYDEVVVHDIYGI